MPRAGFKGKAASVDAFVYVSNAHDGDISTYTLNSERGGRLMLGERVPAGGFVMPMTSSADGKFLFAAVRSKPYSLQSYRIDAASGGLQWLGATPLPDSMVNVSVDKTGRWLLGVSFGGNSLSVNAIGADGRVAIEPTQFIPSGGTGPHAIRADGSNRYVVVPHLGTDELRTYRFDASTGCLEAEVAKTRPLEKGTGPRHFAYSNDGRFLYVIGETSGVVTVLQRDAASATLAEVQRISSQPPDSKLVPGRPRLPSGPGIPAESFDTSDMTWSADLQMTPDGRFLYTSERTLGNLSRFAVDRRTGRLRLLGLTATQAQPRSFAIDPQGRYLIASGEKSATVLLFAIDPATGDLSLRQQVPCGKGASWVQIVQPP